MHTQRNTSDDQKEGSWNESAKALRRVDLCTHMDIQTHTYRNTNDEQIEGSRDEPAKASRRVDLCTHMETQTQAQTPNTSDE